MNLKKPSRSGLSRVLVLLGLIGAAIGIGLWLRPKEAQIFQPPSLDLSHVHPEVAAAIGKGLSEVREKPRDVHSWGELSYLLIANGFTEPALPVLETTQRLDPGNPTWPYLQASIDMLLSRPREATAKFEEALPLARGKDERAAILFYFAQVDIEQARFEAAQKKVDEIRELEGETPLEQYVAGLLATARGETDRALQLLTPLVEHPCARRQASAILATLPHSDPTLSERYRKQVANLPPDRPWPTVFDTKVRQYRVAPSEGLEHFQELMARGQKGEAFDYLHDLASRDPSESNLYALGNTLFQSHDLSGAEKAFRQLLAANSRHAKAQMLLGAAILEQAEQLLQAKQKKEAEARFREVVEHEDASLQIEASSPLSHYLKGRAELRLGQRKEAKASFQQASLIGPDLFEAHLALGELLAEDGQMPEAIRSLENAVRVAPPNNPEPRKALEKWKGKAASRK